MARSMTGFARLQTETPEFSLTLSLKSVNHRFLDVQMRLPPELEAFEIELRRRLKQKLSRGAVQLTAALEIRGVSCLRIHSELVDAYVAASRDIAARHGLPVAPDLAGIFRLPGVVTVGNSGVAPDGALEKVLLDSLDHVLDELTVAREREAAGIVAEMLTRSAAIDAALDRLEQLREGLAETLLARLHQKLSELLQAASLDPQRVLQEAALLAERSDVSEELQRLRSHNAQLRDLLQSPGEVGKKLDFLLQEMNREANTIVSKTSGIGPTGLAVTDLGLALKAAIEKIREQGMNLE